MNELRDGSGKFFPLDPTMKQFVKQEVKDDLAYVW